MLFGFTREACSKDHNGAERTGFAIDRRIGPVDFGPDLGGGECEIEAENDPHRRKYSRGEVIPAAQQGVIDGADLPIVNILALKAYEVSKYCSMTYHNYGPTALVINLDIWNGLTPTQQKLLLDASRTAQERIRGLTESVDTVEKAKELLEPKGMTVNTADVEAFRKIAQEKVWPAYQKEYTDIWEEIVATKV